MQASAAARSDTWDAGAAGMRTEICDRPIPGSQTRLPDPMSRRLQPRNSTLRHSRQALPAECYDGLRVLPAFKGFETDRER
jgi:hypothetical protein